MVKWRNGGLNGQLKCRNTYMSYKRIFGGGYHIYNGIKRGKDISFFTYMERRESSV
ncbi:hypothetical protein CCY01nite_17170 [Chitinophaga cymbidii]|uniref:Uncharacterized protein n=1 Tax=Chitinophaga cymbidii TaxID=1096750 RepID=A0A512RID9_9BACT|nr:hypothetical protein CCY01nite_17170 [Chitinophaga cymbidii]